MTESVPSKSARRLTLADAAVLLAATALGVAMIRYTWGPGVPAPIAQLFAPLPAEAKLPWSAIARAKYFSTVVAVVLLAWTPALLILRLRQPRPVFSQLIHRPGSAAIVLAVIAMTWRAADSLLREAFFHGAGLRNSLAASFAREPSGQSPWDLFQDGTAQAIGLVLLATAPVLFVLRSPPSERDWLDRAGLALALLWIITCVLNRLYWITAFIPVYAR